MDALTSFAAALRGATFFSCMATLDGDADADEAVYARVDASGASDDAVEEQMRAESFSATNPHGGRVELLQKKGKTQLLMRRILLKTARRRVRRRDGAETRRDSTETRFSFATTQAASQTTQAADEADDSILHAAALRGATTTKRIHPERRFPWS